MDILCPNLILMAPALAVEPSARDWIPVPKELTPRSVQRVLHRQGDSFKEPETEEPALTGEDFSRVDDTLLDLEPEDSGTSAPLTGISPLTILPAALPAQNVPATSFTMGPVQQSTTDSSALFRAPHTLSQLQKEWLLCHSHNHIGLSQQQRSHRLLGLNSLGASWNSRISR